MTAGAAQDTQDTGANPTTVMTALAFGLILMIILLLANGSFL